MGQGCKATFLTLSSLPLTGLGCRKVMGSSGLCGHRLALLQVCHPPAMPVNHLDKQQRHQFYEGSSMALPHCVSPPWQKCIPLCISTALLPHILTTWNVTWLALNNGAITVVGRLFQFDEFLHLVCQVSDVVRNRIQELSDVCPHKTDTTILLRHKRKKSSPAASS